MYHVVLIDDEPWALEDLESCFDGITQFNIAGKYTSAKQAWEAMQKNPPDVVFTDVKMPVFTGLDLAKMSKDEGFETKFIIVSGYDDFNFLHDAILVQAFDYCIKPIQKNSIKEILKRLMEAFEKNSKITDPESTTFFIEPTSKIFNPQFQEAVNYINKNFSKSLTLEDISKKFFISESYCAQLFIKHFDMSFSKYLIKLKMVNAAHMLETSTINTAKIAEMVGYSDYYYFNKVFKKHFGLTPYKYARRNENEEA